MDKEKRAHDLSLLHIFMEIKLGIIAPEKSDEIVIEGIANEYKSLYATYLRLLEDQP